jgi:probable F420-dependent oxidoreductase
VTMKYGLSLLEAHPSAWADIAQEAERCGFESVWMSDHLVLPTTFGDADDPDRKLTIGSATPVFDTFVHLADLGARTTTLRLGTYVYQLGLRHPFIAARAITTLDVVTNGRLELGVGAGYVREEWEAAGVDFSRRGARLDESLQVCRRLWDEDIVENPGPEFPFGPVSFEPKPFQRPHPPIHVGGESAAAIRRAVRAGDGWIGKRHTPESARPVVTAVKDAVTASGRDRPLEITMASAAKGESNVASWQALGIDRLIVTPWHTTRDAITGLREFAARNLA